jgi:hypothetical protein
MAASPRYISLARTAQGTPLPAFTPLLREVNTLQYYIFEEHNTYIFRVNEEA